MIYLLAIIMALLCSGMFSCGIVTVLGLAASGIAGTMHGIENDPLSLLGTTGIVALLCLAVFVFVLIRYILLCRKIRNLKHILLSLLLSVVALPLFTSLIVSLL